MTSTEKTTPRRSVGPLDWIMLVLAVASIGLLGWETFGSVSHETALRIFQIDVTICGIFAVEFLWRWRRAGWRRDFLWRNWYEILGMIPVSHPALRSFRLIRLIRIVVLLSRLGKALDRSVGEEFTYRLTTRFANSVVHAIKKPITVAVLDEVIAVMRTGHYTRNIAAALEENRHELRRMALDKIKADPQFGRLSFVPFHDQLVQTAADAVLRVVLEILADPRTDELVSDMLRENLDQIRIAVHSDQHVHTREDAPGNVTVRPYAPRP